MIERPDWFWEEGRVHDPDRCPICKYWHSEAGCAGREHAADEMRKAQDGR